MGAPAAAPDRSRRELRLGTGVFLGAAVLLVLTIGLGVAFATWKANRAAEERLRRNLAAVPAIFKGYEASQAESRRSQVSSVAEEAGSKALLAEGGASPETAHDFSQSVSRATGAGAVFLFDARGALICRSDRSVGEDYGRDFSGVSWVRTPLVDLVPATAYILDATRRRALYLVASAPVTQGEKSEMKLNGVLAAAFPMDDERARELALVAAGETVVLANLAPRDAPPALQVLAASGRLKGPALRDTLLSSREAFSALFRDGRPYGPFEFSDGDEVWVGTALPILSGSREPIAALVVARGKRAELAAFEGIRNGIALAGLFILLASFPLSLALARRASRPIEQLAAAATSIGGGRAPAPLPRSRWKEVGALSRAFGAMVGQLEERDAERRRAEEITAGWKERYEAAILASGQVVYDWEPQTGAVTFGGNTERILGRTADDLSGGRTAWTAWVHSEDRDAFRAETDRVLKTRGPFHLEYRLLRADGTEIVARDEGYFVREAAGEAARMVGFIADVTQERLLEERLRQSQRIEAVGRLAGGVAHDFNNLLTVVLGTASLLVSRCGDGDGDLREDLTEILRAAERASLLTRQLLAFSRRPVLKIEAADLNAIVSEMESMLRRLIGEDVELTTATGAPEAPVRVDRTQIGQVVMNLAVNARDAMAKGGHLSIATGEAELDAPAAAERGVKPGRYVTLAVRDTGAGMSPAVMERIFEPFFTTKAPGKGTGLGLATAYTIVRQSDGYIGVESEPGQGTTFHIFLPRAEAPADEDDEDSFAGPIPRGNETVLLVEDEEGVRRLARKVLAEHGYEVLEAASGAEALERVDGRKGPIDLVLTDVVMPGMSGPDLATALDQLLPGVPVLFMSGHPDEALLQHGVDISRVAFVQKPLTPRELTRSVRGKLDEQARSDRSRH